MMMFALGFLCGDIAASVVLLFFMGANSQHHPKIVARKVDVLPPRL